VRPHIEPDRRLRVVGEMHPKRNSGRRSEDISPDEGFLIR